MDVFGTGDTISQPRDSVSPYAGSCYPGPMSLIRTIKDVQMRKYCNLYSQFKTDL